MPQFHYLQEPIKAHGEKTTAYWAVQPKSEVIVFVHGFKGESLGTWLEFPSLSVSDARSRGVDLIFFGYDGLFTQAGVSALIFFNFMRALAASPKSLMPAFINRRADFAYSKIVIVAHSLGAVVSRRAIVDAVRSGEEWPSRSHLVLFAPAHNGAYAAQLASEHLSNGQGWSLGGIASGLARYKIPLFEDLKHDSPVIEQLRGDIQAELQKPNPPRSLTAQTVAWAQKENVVINARYLNDALPQLFPLNHSDVCKPKATFREPLDLVFGPSEMP